MPGGKPTGVKGAGPRASARLREVTGGKEEAERIFQELTQGGKDITPAGLLTKPGMQVGHPAADGRHFVAWDLTRRCIASMKNGRHWAENPTSARWRGLIARRIFQHIALRK
jgi:hypothetical protein